MQIAARRAFLTQDHRLALVWRLLSYLFLFIVVNLVANVARVVLQSVGVPSVMGRLVFTLLYISGTLGLTYGYRRFIDRRPYSPFRSGGGWRFAQLSCMCNHVWWFFMSSTSLGNVNGSVSSVSGTQTATRLTREIAALAR